MVKQVTLTRNMLKWRLAGLAKNMESLRDRFHALLSKEDSRTIKEAIKLINNLK